MPIMTDANVLIEMPRSLRNAIRGRRVVSTELARLESRIGALRRDRSGRPRHLELADLGADD
jgi:hypothetical protein